MIKHDMTEYVNRILKNYNKNQPIELEKLKKELSDRFHVVVDICILKEYLREKGYRIGQNPGNQPDLNRIGQNPGKQSDLNRIGQNPGKQSDLKLPASEIENDDDDFDPNEFLTQNEEKIRKIETETGTYRENTWLIELYQRENSQNVLSEIVKRNMGLVEKAAYRYQKNYGNKLDFDDLVSEGVLGLLKAVEKFDPAKGYQFSTYATWWIRQSITRAIIDCGYTIRVPVHVFEAINQVLRVEKESVARFNKIDPDWVIEELQINKERYLELKKINYQFLHLASLDSVVSEDDEDSTLIDLIANDPDAVLTKPSEEYLDPEDYALNMDLRETLKQCMDLLTDREQEVLKYRFGWHDGEIMTLEEIGKKYHVTRERIRQIEARALRKLRVIMQGRKLSLELLGAV